MKVNKEEFVQLLSERSGLSVEEVERQLQELSRQVQEAAADNKKYEIEGFGSFSPGDEGELIFTPSKNLQTEINHRYTGMKPIELIGAFKDAPDVGESTDDSGEVRPSDKKSGISDIEEFTGEVPAAGAGIEDKGDADTDTDFNINIDTGSEESVHSDEDEGVPVPGEPAHTAGASFVFDKEYKDDSDTGQVLSGEARGEDAAVSEHVPSDPADGGKMGKRTGTDMAADRLAGEEENDPIGRVLIAAVIVISLAVSGWLVYDSGLLKGGGGTTGDMTMASASSTSQNSSPSLSNPADTQAEKARKGDSDQLSGEAQEGIEETAPPAEQKKLKAIKRNNTGDGNVSRSIAEQSRQSIYGLRGGAVPEANSGYTIVVHSLQNESRARSLNRELESNGYITVLSSAVVNGTTYWRVGLGQFKTVEDARRAIENLPPSYQKSHFIKRIQ